MKVWYRFPDLELWEEMQDWQIMGERAMQLYIAKKNKDVFKDIIHWLHNTNGAIPKLEMHTHKDYPKDLIKCAMSFTVPDDIAMLFKLKFGDGFNG